MRTVRITLRLDQGFIVMFTPRLGLRDWLSIEPSLQAHHGGGPTLRTRRRSHEHLLAGRLNAEHRSVEREARVGVVAVALGFHAMDSRGLTR